MLIDAYQYVAGPTTDPDFASVVLLAPLTNDSPAWIDQSSYAHTLTPAGGISRDTTKFPYPPASAATDGNGDYLSIPIASEFQPGSSEFTLECWVRPPASLPGSLKFIFSTRATTGNDAGIYIFLTAAGKVSVRVPPGNGGANLVQFDSGANLSAGVWTHVCLMRKVDAFYLFFNGVLQGSGSVGAGVSVATTNGSVWIGSSSNETGSRDWDGNLGPVRWTIGVARYAAAGFSTPPLPFATTA